MSKDARHRLGHLDLAVALGAAQRGDRRGQQLARPSWCLRHAGVTSAGAGSAGSPLDSFRPSQGRLQQARGDTVAGGRQVSVAGLGEVRLVHPLAAAHQLDRQRLDGSDPAGVCRLVARPVHDLLDHGARRLGQSQRLPCGRRGIPCGVLRFWHRQAVHLDQLVDHARGGRA